MRSETYSCDVCGRVKKEANHWFLVTYSGGQSAYPPRIHNVPPRIYPRTLILEAWEGATPEAIFQSDINLCGAECVNKVVGKFLSGQEWKS